VIVIRADSFVESVRAVWEVLRDGQPLGRGPGLVGYAQGRRITVTSETEEPVQLDGEPHGTTPFTVEIVPNAIRVLVPARPR
jgi:diacylglycerol kinase family enzyme